MIAIELKNISKIYPMGDAEVRALNDVSLCIEAGEFVAIMGASGSGKSTLLQILGLLDLPTSGSYRLLGKEVSKLREDELASIRSQTLGFIFQMFNLLPRTSAVDQVSLPLLYSTSISQDHPKPESLLQMVGLGSRLYHKPNELSGGQQQRVAIARALINQPKMILADEPTGNLDSKSSEEIIQFLGEMNQKGITVILVTHEPDIAAHARRIITMKDGQILTDHPNSDIQASLSNSDRPAEIMEQVVLEKHNRFSFRQGQAYFQQALRSLLANKVRSGLSILGILIGVAAVIAVLAIGTGAQKSMKQRLASLGTNLLMLRPGSVAVNGVQRGLGNTSTITYADAEAITQVPGVKAVAPELSGLVQVTYGDKNWDTEVDGTTPPFALMRSDVPILGRFFSWKDVQMRRRVCLVGMTVIKNIFGNHTNPIGEWIKINRVNFQVIGILPVKGSNGFMDQDNIILIPITTAMYRLFGKLYINLVDIQADSAQDTDLVATLVKNFMMKLMNVPDLPGEQNAFQVRNLADIQATLSAMTKIMTLLLSSIAAISLLVGGIGIMNIMLVAVTERTREIGLRKAIGARQLDILSQFLIESMAVGIVGGIIGIVLGSGLVVGVSALFGWAGIITVGSVVLAVVFSAMVGVLAGLWPAIQASRLSPILALRYE
jgi:macrolide transport system ATP-binding/permease protein